MFTRDTRRPPAKLYQQDIVQRTGDTSSYGIVMRCWHDAEDAPPPSTLVDPLMRPLEYGEVGVSFISNNGEREILRESDLTLIDRTLQPGDYCKRKVDDVRSGVVTSVKVRGRLRHVITGEPVDGWWTMEDVLDRTDAEVGDYVIYDDWVGQVIEVFDESIIEVQGGQLVRLPELGSRLNVGEKGVDILPIRTSSMQNLLGFLLGSPATGTNDTVIAVKHTVYAIAWLAVSQALDPNEAERRQRPKRFWSGQDIGDLTLIQGKSDLEIRMGDRVRLKTPAGIPSSRHGKEGDATGIFIIQTLQVTETETTMEILWQDGYKEQVKATDIIPYLNPDEYDCWPGDHVVWKNEDQRRAAIVQSVNSKDRTAVVLFPDTGETELVSVLELDLHSISDSAAMAPLSSSDTLGVRRGDFVFVHQEGTTNGLERPRVPRIGELEGWIRENTFTEGQFAGWRKELSEIGSSIAARRASENVVEKLIQRPAHGGGSFHWIGEVTNLNLDGAVEVTHPDYTVRNYPLERLTRLYDGIEQLEDDLWDEDGSEERDSDTDGEPVWSMDEDGVWRPEILDGSANDWEDIEDDEIVVDNDDVCDDVDINADNWVNQPLPPVDNPTFSSAVTASTTLQSSPTAEADRKDTFIFPEDISIAADDKHHEDIQWKRFDVLPDAPHDHAFYSSAPATPSKAFLGRLTREYRALASSLPESILVRAYEDRTDLLRSLIIGPENTPYQDAPFVIDWMLDSNFPNSPPIAHFLSWTNGNGRVNPNLYEEGKVCLSILGTWAGDRNETWSASRSSLLQALVSIQGLVLVKEPWFCEPAYEKLRGTEEGTVNSRLYSEKAYVLSRGFVRRALEIPLGGLEEEIKWLYYHKGRLGKVLRDARQLVEKSKISSATTEEDRDEAVPRLTAGGIITLERTLMRLQALYDHP